MHVAVIGMSGALMLGSDAERLGFRPGAVVQIIVTSAGSLILALDQSPPALDVAFRALPGRRPESSPLRRALR